MECLSGCSFHNSGACHWVKRIDVTFDSVQGQGLTPDRGALQKSGRIFSGTAVVTHRYCNETTDRTQPFSVATGGYTQHDDISGDDDSACPECDNPDTTTTADKPTGGAIDGHQIAIPAATGRDGIEFHLAGQVDVNQDTDPTTNYDGPLGSSGCIVVQTVNEWNDFTSLLLLNDGAGACVHKPNDPIPTKITYDLDGAERPTGNEPGNE